MLGRVKSWLVKISRSCSQVHPPAAAAAAAAVVKSRALVEAGMNSIWASFWRRLETCGCTQPPNSVRIWSKIAFKIFEMDFWLPALHWSTVIQRMRGCASVGFRSQWPMRTIRELAGAYDNKAAFFLRSVERRSSSLCRQYPSYSTKRAPFLFNTPCTARSGSKYFPPHPSGAGNLRNTSPIFVRGFNATASCDSSSASARLSTRSRGHPLAHHAGADAIHRPSDIPFHTSPWRRKICAVQLNMGQEEFNLLGISASLGTLKLQTRFSIMLLEFDQMRWCSNYTESSRYKHCIHSDPQNYDGPAILFQGQSVQSSLKGRVHIRFGGSISIICSSRQNWTDRTSLQMSIKLQQNKTSQISIMQVSYETSKFHCYLIMTWHVMPFSHVCPEKKTSPPPQWSAPVPTCAACAAHSSKAVAITRPAVAARGQLGGPLAG